MCIMDIYWTSDLSWAFEIVQDFEADFAFCDELLNIKIKGMFWEIINLKIWHLSLN